MPPSHCLELVNESPMAGWMCVYLENPDAGAGSSFPLVWQGRDCGPGRSFRLDWEEEWGLTFGPVTWPGLVFSGGEIQPAEPGASFILGSSASGPSLRPAAPAPRDADAGEASEDYVPENIAAGFVLSLKPGEKRQSLAELARSRPSRPAPAADRIQISVEPDAPALAVALCLAGQPALLSPAEPGRSLEFPARLSYRAAFGSFEQGLVLDPDQMFMSTKFDFPGGPLRVVFQRDCNWGISTGA
jgi:hypothetical protein